MKVLLLNGSPHEKGCTYTALTEVAEELQRQEVETEILHVAKGALPGCLNCGYCREHPGVCVYNDIVNVAIAKAKEADGFIFGSPVYYASANGTMVSFMDRFFQTRHPYFAYKPAAVVTSARRAGTLSAYDQLNKYIGISEMIMVPCMYWNMVHGSTPQEVKQDEEGLYIMRDLGRNMAWLLRLLESGKQHGVALPTPEPNRPRTNFIR